jgi:hypothetical protein
MLRGRRVVRAPLFVLLQLATDADVEQPADGAPPADRPAPRMISGNGRCSRKIETNAATATPTISPFASAFLPIRMVADATIPTTAAARPEKIALTHVTSPCAA